MPVAGFAVLLLMVPAAQGGGPGTASAQPLPRSFPGLTTAPNGTVLLFGGSSHELDASLGDTWTWDGKVWTEQHPATSPSPRCCFGLAFDVHRQEVVLFGGYTDTFLGDTWVWDGVDWEQRHPATSPPAGQGVSMAYDAARQEVVLFGGQPIVGTWTWDGSTWTEEHPIHSPDWRMGAGMGYDPIRQEIVMSGGGYFCFEWTCYYRETWIWNGRVWRERRTHPTRQAAGWVGMAFDRSTGEVVSFGGLSLCCIYRSTWTWDGMFWTYNSPAERPDARYATGMAWDSAGGQVILFGGRTYHDDYHDFGDTWSWDGSNWSCLAGCSSSAESP